MPKNKAKVHHFGKQQTSPKHDSTKSELKTAEIRLASHPPGNTIGGRFIDGIDFFHNKSTESICCHKKRPKNEGSTSRILMATPKLQFR